MICVRNLTKRFGKFCAVNNVSFDIEAGEIFGFIGPNGAGKTTTIRMLSTLLEPDGGSAWIDGHSIQINPQKVRHCIGYMPDYFGVYEGVTVWEYLEFFARAYHIPIQTRNKIVDDCLSITDCAKMRDKLVATLSKGQTQRMCLAKTLLHNPKVLILDEPTSGLDPRARIDFRGLIKELANMGKTIFISSHILTEMADFVTHIGIMEHGKMIIYGTPQDISERLSKGIIVVNIAIHQGKKIEQAKEILQNFPHVKSVTQEKNSLEVEYQGKEEEIHRLLRILVDVEIPVVQVSQQTKNLEDIFMQVTQGDIE